MTGQQGYKAQSPKTSRSTELIFEDEPSMSDVGIDMMGRTKKRPQSPNPIIYLAPQGTNARGSAPPEESGGGGAPEAVKWIAEYIDAQTEVGSIAARCMAERIVEYGLRFLQLDRL